MVKQRKNGKANGSKVKRKVRRRAAGLSKTAAKAVGRMISKQIDKSLEWKHILHDAGSSYNSPWLFSSGATESASFTQQMFNAYGKIYKLSFQTQKGTGVHQRVGDDILLRRISVQLNLCANTDVDGVTSRPYQEPTAQRCKLFLLRVASNVAGGVAAGDIRDWLQALCLRCKMPYENWSEQLETVTALAGVSKIIASKDIVLRKKYGNELADQVSLCQEVSFGYKCHTKLEYLPSATTPIEPQDFSYYLIFRWGGFAQEQAPTGQRAPTLENSRIRIYYQD